MTMAYRFYVCSPQGEVVHGFATREGAEVAAKAHGEGAWLIDTHALTYEPMLYKVLGEEVVMMGVSGWNAHRAPEDENLREAIRHGHLPLVLAFLARGADPNARDPRGGTALHWAASGGREEVVAALLAHGADASLRDQDGESPLDIAEKRGRAAVAALLRQALKSVE